jgi:hypothetical protein
VISLLFAWLILSSLTRLSPFILECLFQVCRNFVFRAGQSLIPRLSPMAKAVSRNLFFWGRLDRAGWRFYQNDGSARGMLSWGTVKKQAKDVRASSIENVSKIRGSEHRSGTLADRDPTDALGASFFRASWPS